MSHLVYHYLNITPGLNLTSSLASNPGGILGAPGTATGSVYDIKIVSINGSVIKSTTTAQLNWQTDLSALSPGTYIIQVVDSNKSLVGKSTFIKL